MPISESDLRKLISIKCDIDKVTSLSSDGKSLLTRIPLEIKEHLKLEKGDKIRWTVNSLKKIKIEVIKKNATA